MTLAIFVLALIAGVMAYIRLAPVDVARWHVPPADAAPPKAGWRGWVLYPPASTDGPQFMPGGAYAAAYFPGGSLTGVLGKLDAIAMATPRTRRLAGSAETGMITWETRSAIWGFPDYTTAFAEARKTDARVPSTGAGVLVYMVGRQRFGSNDLGVNAARLTDWLGRIAG